MHALAIGRNVDPRPIGSLGPADLGRRSEHAPSPKRADSQGGRDAGDAEFRERDKFPAATSLEFAELVSERDVRHALCFPLERWPSLAVMFPIGGTDLSIDRRFELNFAQSSISA